MEDNKTHDEKYFLIKLLISLITPFVIAVVGYFAQSAIKEKDVRSVLIQESIKILLSEQKNENIPMRKWAVDVINIYSDVVFDENQKNFLIYNIPYSAKIKTYENTITPENLETDEKTGELNIDVIKENSSFGTGNADMEKINKLKK